MTANNVHAWHCQLCDTASTGNRCKNPKCLAPAPLFLPPDGPSHPPKNDRTDLADSIFDIINRCTAQGQGIPPSDVVMVLGWMRMGLFIQAVYQIPVTMPERARELGAALQGAIFAHVRTAGITPDVVCGVLDWVSMCVFMQATTRLGEGEVKA